MILELVRFIGLFRCAGLPRCRCEIGTAALPPKGFFFVLDNKEAKNQGLDLMSDKFVKAFIAAAQAPDEESGENALP